MLCYNTLREYYIHLMYLHGLLYLYINLDEIYYNKYSIFSI